jgi:hypothetical protein
MLPGSKVLNCVKKMTCRICQGEVFIERVVEEEIRMQRSVSARVSVDCQVGTVNDIVLVPILCFVCRVCGERQYDTATIEYIKRVCVELRSGRLPLKQVGIVMTID